MRVILSVDPGTQGGLCLMSGKELEVHKMPATIRDTCDLFERALACAGSPQEIRAYIEKVGGYVGEGQPASSAFNFGMGYGAIQGILIALKIPYELITPQVWQAGLGMGTKGLQRATITPGMSSQQRKDEFKRIGQINGRLKTIWKNKLKAVAQQLYPYVNVILATSDCLLILEYARRRELMPQAEGVKEIRTPRSLLTTGQRQRQAQEELL